MFTMPRGFPNGCPLPEREKAFVLRESGSRRGKGTCNTCIRFGQTTQTYRDKPCPYMKGYGKYGWKGIRPKF